MTVLIPLAVIAAVLAWILWPKAGTFKNRRVAILVTTIPLVILTIASLVYQSTQNSTGGTGVADISNTLFIVGLCLIGAAFIALVFYALAHKVETARGLGFGITIMAMLSIIGFASLEALAGV